MENPYKLICFGHSLTRGYVPAFEAQLKVALPDIEAVVINAGVGGETSRDGLRRLEILLAQRPQVVILGFGMNDQAKGVTTVELANNLCRMIPAFEEIGARVLLLTINPVDGVPGDSRNARIDAYNQVIKDVAWEKRIRVVDINSLWKREIFPLGAGLKDSCHPNDLGNKLYCKALLQVLPRSRMILLWQYNGNPCECNFRCPYCSYDPRTQKGHHFKGTTEGWHRAFKSAFGNRHVAFYLAHGEPMIGKKFHAVLEMVGGEPNWEVRMTSNISPRLDKLVKTRVAREGRLNINASFHPHMVKRERFLGQALFLRKHGIEVPVIYVMYPSLLERFEDDFHFFDAHNFLVHVRRFRGFYEGKAYPEAYTDEERQFIAKYCDDATIKYMLSNEPSYGKLTWSGVDFMIVDNQGNVGYCDDFRPDRHSLGNVFDGTFRPLSVPLRFPGGGVSDGTVDGVANFLELGYRQLTGNNVLSFSRQGGVYHKSDGVYYKNMYVDFADSRIRAEYRFPPRNLKDCYHIWRCKERDARLRRKEVVQFLTPKPFLDLGTKTRALLAKVPGARSIHGLLLGH